MRKEIMYLIVGVILASFVVADTNVDMSIMTDQDLYFNADLNAGGNIDLTIDGMNFDDTVTDLYENDMSMKGVYWRLAGIFMNKDYKNMWYIVNPLKLDKYEQRFRWVMDTYFVPRTEVNQMRAYYEQRLMDAELRIEAIEYVLGEEAVLKGRLNVAKDYGIDLTFNNKTYLNMDSGGFITLEPVEQQEEPEIIILEEPKEDPRIEIWQELCDKGIEKWCIILEKRGY